MERGGCVYIMTNYTRQVLYVGVTSDLIWRLMEHRAKKFGQSFTARYRLTICVYYENFSTIDEAIAREKQLKNWRRVKKEMLINSFNPGWNDLWETEVKYW